MDKFKGLAKGGWHPPGDPSVSRKTWKQDLKGIATGKKNDPNEEKLNHESKPLASLRDPSTFGPPPKHSAYYGPNGSSSALTRANTGSPVGGSGGLGAPVPAPRPRLTQEELVAQEEAAKPPSGPYRRDTSGLRTDHLPPPPVRRTITPGASPGPPPPPRANSGLPARATPPLPSRGAAARPPPVLPPRQNEYPDENTPAPPPTYGEATQPVAPNPASLNQSALNRLGQAGVSVPGFGIGGSNASTTAPAPPSTQGHFGQLNELQQRFSRLGTGSTPAPTPQAQPAAGPSWQQYGQNPQARAALSYAGQQTGVIPSPAGAAAAAKKKPAPPPPPPKKSNLQTNESGGPAPPPIPMSSKPRLN